MTDDKREALILRASEAASKKARQLRMDVHHGELDQCVRAALAVAERVVRKDERAACAAAARVRAGMADHETVRKE